jgi:thiol-disulfide isomerase/thioredoxin
MAAAGCGGSHCQYLSQTFPLPNLCIMKLIIGILAILLPVLSGAQVITRPLTVGDYVPDTELSHVLNYPATSIHLPGLKDKLIILDLWSSWCSSCIAFFPHLDSLQLRYKNDIQIILVNARSRRYHDDAAKINTILSRVQENTGVPVSMPVAYDCPQLDGWFPFKTLPHEVWISNGKVVAITYPNEVVPANIDAILSGKKTFMRLKEDRFDVDVTQPLFINGNGGTGTETLYRSLLTGYLRGVNGQTGIFSKNDSITGLYAINQSLFTLVKMAWGDSIRYIDNRVILDVDDKEHFNIAYEDTGAYRYQYTYELMLPPVTDSMLHAYMQADLQRWFHISVWHEVRKMKCLVLHASLVTAPGQVHYDQGEALESYYAKKFIHNYPPADVVRLLNFHSSTPIIDETGSTAPISVDLPRNLNDATALCKAFAASGLILREEERDIGVTVITDR